MSLYGTTYYVSSAGNDGSNGTSTSTSWATLNKVNGFSFVAGDNILFNRGDTFYGTLKINSSGTSASRITFGAYGTGANPVITGFTTISGWTNYGNGIYSKAITPETDVNMVTVDGVNTMMGRYPKTGNWLAYSSVSNLGLTCNSLSSSPSWTGADVIIRRQAFFNDRLYITNHSGTTITCDDRYGSKGDATGNIGDWPSMSHSGWGFFFERSLATLSTVNGVTPVLGEWFHNGTTFYMYFGAIDPTTKIVKVATLNNGAVISGSYIKIDNISFQGSSTTSIDARNGNYLTVTNCETRFSGVFSVFPSANCTIDNSYLHDTHAVCIYGSVSGLTLTNSTLENIAVNDGGWYGWDDAGVGILNSGSNIIVQYNTFRNTGYDGIYLGGDNVLIDKNLFDNTCSRSFDQGAIYTNGTGKTNYVISNNIVINTVGSMSGASGSWTIWTTAEGIYLDEPCSGVTISGNTVYNTVHGSGIKLHEAHDITILNNTLYNNEEGFQFLGSGAQPNDPVRNIDMDGNKIIAISAGQMFWIFWSINDEIPSFGTANGQYYARPINDGVNQDFYTREVTDGEGYRTYAYWLSRSGEAGSNMSSITLTDANKIRIDYNATKVNKVVALDAGYVDVTGTKYSGSITLLPYTSVVLMLDPNASAPPVVPVYTSSSIENATPALLEMIYSLSLGSTIPVASAFSVMVNSVARTVSTVAISGTKVQLSLASPVVTGDKVTVSYTKPTTNPIQTQPGGQAITIANQPVTNNVNSVISGYVSSAIAASTPSILEMTYSQNMANIVPASSAFTVLVNTVARTVNTVTISGTKVQLTLSKQVVTGDVITVSYTKPASNPLQTSTSVAVNSIINQPVINNCGNVAPVAVLTSPVSNSSFVSPAVISLTATATDADGSVSLVEFYNGSTKIGSVSSAPYAFTWNNVTAGSYSLTAVVTDNLKATTVSPAVTVSVTDKKSTNKHPVIHISNPHKGNSYTNLSTVTIDADASDPDGTVSKVEFYNGSEKLVEVTASPYTYIWKNVLPGSYSITAIATDNLNDTTKSSPVEFVVGSTVKYDAKSDVVKLYPNPNNGQFSIEFVSPLQSDNCEIVITDLAGKQVYNGPVKKEELSKQFDLSGSRSGIYVMLIKDKDIIVTKKFIKN
jgi:uncharacterized repeat protein (TIGR02059 family)